MKYYLATKKQENIFSNVNGLSNQMLSEIIQTNTAWAYINIEYKTNKQYSDP